MQKACSVNKPSQKLMGDFTPSIEHEKHVLLVSGQLKGTGWLPA